MTRSFARFARKERIRDEALCEAVARAERGLIDADLGGHVIKQRVARPGAGRSGGYRTLIAFKHEDRAIFMFGFAKADQDNIGDDALKTLRKSASEMLSWGEEDIEQLLSDGAWLEIDCHE